MLLRCAFTYFTLFVIDETFPLRLLEGEKVKVWVVQMEKFQHWSAEGPAESVLPLLTQVKRPSREVAGHILHSHYSLCPSLSGLAQRQNKTGLNCSKQSSLQRGFPPSRTFKGLGSGKWQLTSMQTPHILDTHF